MSSFRKLRRILDSHDVRSLASLAFVVVAAAIAELAGIFSILPFMKVVADPSSIETNTMLRWFVSITGLESSQSVIVGLGILVLVVYAISAAINVFAQWTITRTVWRVAHRISLRLLDQYTRMPYEFFLANNSAELVKKLISDIHNLVSGVLMAGTRFSASALKAVLILVFLLFVNAPLACIAFAIYGAAYGLLHNARHRRLKQLGEDRQRTLSRRIRSFSETLSGIKSLRVGGATGPFVERFAVASKRFSEIQPQFQLYNLVPRHAIEFLAFGGIIAVVLYLLLTGADLVAFIPTLSVFAMATYKLLPTLGTAFTQAANVSHNLPVIDTVYEDMVPESELLPPLSPAVLPPPLPFGNKIKISNLHYRYQTSGLPVLDGISLEIPRGSKCAIVGTTGCGKSTLIDIMVGLLRPQSGDLFVDEEQLGASNLASWQQIIAYVPQDIFLYDATVAENIALGAEPGAIDKAHLQFSAQVAQANAFIQNELDQQYETVIGELGIRLSGGQRQRLGIARAIYRRPKILFLDEATSALDNVTEEATVAAIDAMLPDMTVVMIAHRLSSVRFCDRIFMMDQGRIVGVGTYDELLKSNDKFRRMVEVGE